MDAEHMDFADSCPGPGALRGPNGTRVPPPTGRGHDLQLQSLLPAAREGPQCVSRRGQQRRHHRHDKRRAGKGGIVAVKPRSDCLGPVYTARISLDHTAMQIEDKEVNLSPA